MPAPTHRRALPLLAAGAVLSLSLSAWAAPAYAAGDRDGDGMPNRWEARHGLDPDRANAAGDPDRDGLANLREYRKDGHPQREDTDRDGHDDGDEVEDGKRGTSIDDPDGDGDDVLDGDEDSDKDGVDNEDEDDASESCGRDDDDRDDDHVSDEDENDHGTRAGDPDSDDDDTLDGDEDSDDDGQSDEDDDDSDEDVCDDHGDEDERDHLGSIVSFVASEGGDGVLGTLVIDTVHLGERSYLVTEATEIEWDSSGPGSGDDRARSDEVEGSVDDLDPGTGVAEIDLDDDVEVEPGSAPALEEIELSLPG